MEATMKQQPRRDPFTMRFGMADDGSRLCDNCLTCAPVCTVVERPDGDMILCPFCLQRQEIIGSTNRTYTGQQGVKDARSVFASAVFRMNHVRRTLGEDCDEYRQLVIERDEAKRLWQQAG